MEKLYQIFKASKGISTDTRNITEGSLFFALKGENFDANTMVDKALDNGATMLLLPIRLMKVIQERLSSMIL